jgi:hypothetical protein
LQRVGHGVTAGSVDQRIDRVVRHDHRTRRPSLPADRASRGPAAPLSMSR